MDYIGVDILNLLLYINFRLDISKHSKSRKISRIQFYMWEFESQNRDK